MLLGRISVSYTHLDVYKRQDREQSGDALDHHVANLRLGFSDEGDPFRWQIREGRMAQRHALDPFGAGAGLAGAASAQDQPDRLQRLWRQLIGACPDLPCLLYTSRCV